MNGKDSQVIHFRRHLPPASSEFEISVSRAFCLDHAFSFRHLAIYPGLVSVQASRNDMDIEAELAVVTDEIISLGAKKLGSLVSMEFTNPNNRTTPGHYVKDFNQFFHDSIPSHLVEQPFFFDWYDLNKTDLSPKQLEAHVKQSFELYYQLQQGQYTQTLENGLPQRLKEMLFTNPMAIPTFPLEMTLQDSVVFRLHMAPFSKLVSSTDKIFEALGFNTEKIKATGTGDHHKKFVLVNDTPDWRTIWGSQSPLAVMRGIPSHKINFGHALEQISSDERWISFTQKEFRNNKELLEKLKPHIQDLATEINIKFDLMFDKTSGKFKVLFPPGVTEPWVNFSSNLQYRLGLGYNSVVDPKVKSQERFDNAEFPNADKKMKTLMMDTGVVICTRNTETSPFTAGLTENFMASLHPKMMGILETKNPLDYKPQQIYFDDLKYGSGPTADLKFKFFRFMDDGKMVPFEWKMDAFVLGELHCTPLGKL